MKFTTAETRLLKYALKYLALQPIAEDADPRMKRAGEKAKAQLDEALAHWAAYWSGGGGVVEEILSAYKLRLEKINPQDPKGPHK